LGYNKVSLWPMPMILVQEVINLFRNVGGEVSLVTLLAHIGRDIPDDEQLFPAPDFQHRFTGFQFTAAQIAPINYFIHLLTLSAHVPV